MALPTIENVTRELVSFFQTEFGTAVDVVGSAAGAGQVIEVADGQGAPVVELQNKPKLEIAGPIGSKFVEMFRRPAPTEQVETAKNPVLFTVDRSPFPVMYDYTYRVMGWAARDTVSTEGARGILWLQGALTPLDSDYLLGAGWTGDAPNGAFPGYFWEWASAPAILPGRTASGLYVLQASIVVRRVRVAKLTGYETAPTTSTVTTTLQDENGKALP